jgi:GH25 family lysozyme M1 (1,4-beta-N-acetylmuramidase)
MARKNIFRTGIFLSVVMASALVNAAPASAATTQGIDVSHHQSDRGTISWGQVRSAGQRFVYVKATEGYSYSDPAYRANRDGAAAAGLLTGAYHFARPDSGSGDALAEAEQFVGVVGRSLSGQLPPALDLEDDGGLSSAALITWTRTFLNEVERLTGRVPVIYVSPAFWRDELADSHAFTRHPLWIAHYTTGTPSIPGGWPAYTFWQNTKSYSVAGITGAVDHDFFNGTVAQLQALAGGGAANPYTPVEVCGDDYSVIDQAALGGAAGTVYLLYNADNQANCVTTIKSTSIGTASAAKAYLEVQGRSRVTDSGSFAYYAGPVRAEAGNTCVKWGGAVGANAYDSPFEHCG